MKLSKEGYYFTVGFADPDLTVPIITTLKYLSEEKTSQGEIVSLFEKITMGSDDERMFVREQDVDELVITKQRLVELLQQSLDGTLTSP